MGPLSPEEQLLFQLGILDPRMAMRPDLARQLGISAGEGLRLPQPSPIPAPGTIRLGGGALNFQLPADKGGDLSIYGRNLHNFGIRYKKEY